MSSDTPKPESRFSEIETHAEQIRDAAYCVRRYGHAIVTTLCAYLTGKLHDRGEAEDAAGVLLDRLIHKFEAGSIQDRWNPDRGRFRNYLKATVFNTARDYLRERTAPGMRTAPLSGDEEAPDVSAFWECECDAAMRAAVVNNAWKRLEEAEAADPECVSFTLLTLKGRDDADSEAIRTSLEGATGRSLTPGAFRGLLFRARRQFAECLLREAMLLCRTDRVTEGEDELRDLGLWDFFHSYLDGPTESP